MLRSVLLASLTAFDAASSQLFGDSDIDNFNHFCHVYFLRSSPVEDRTPYCKRFLVDVRRRQFEGVLNQLAAGRALFRQQDFNHVEPKNNFGIIE